MGATRVIAVDGYSDRLDRARDLGAEVVNFNDEGTIEAVLELTGGIGPDRAIDAVGVDAARPKQGPVAEQAESQSGQLEERRRQIVQESSQNGRLWKPGDAPMRAGQWAVESLAKAGTLSVIGVYPQTDVFSRSVRQ